MNLKLTLTPGTGIDPIYTSVLDSPEYRKAAPKVQAAAAQALNGALAWPTGASASRMLQSLADQLALVLDASKTPKQAMQDAQATWLGILNG